MALASYLLGLHDRETLFNSPWPFPARPRSMEPQLAGCSGKIARDPHSNLPTLGAFLKMRSVEVDHHCLCSTKASGEESARGNSIGRTVLFPENTAVLDDLDQGNISQSLGVAEMVRGDGAVLDLGLEEAPRFKVPRHEEIRFSVSDKKVKTFLSVYKKKPETKNDRITH